VWYALVVILCDHHHVAVAPCRQGAVVCRGGTATAEVPHFCSTTQGAVTLLQASVAQAINECEPHNYKFKLHAVLSALTWGSGRQTEGSRGEGGMLPQTDSVVQTAEKQLHGQ
jgi:hypothetical protein